MRCPELIFKVGDVRVRADHAGWTVSLRRTDLVTYKADRAAALRFARDLCDPVDLLEAEAACGLVDA